jgi:hypothetical protein
MRIVLVGLNVEKVDERLTAGLVSQYLNVKRRQLL